MMKFKNMSGVLGKALLVATALGAAFEVFAKDQQERDIEELKREVSELKAKEEN